MKALEYLKIEQKIFQQLLDSYEEDDKDDEAYQDFLKAFEEVNEAIAELEQFVDDAESIRMLCDDRAERIAELEAL